jgi:hypothetical protein
MVLRATIALYSAVITLAMALHLLSVLAAADERGR